jgi:hypothetical protein
VREGNGRKVVEMRDVMKSFGPARALDGISLDVWESEKLVTFMGEISFRSGKRLWLLRSKLLSFTIEGGAPNFSGRPLLAAIVAWRLAPARRELSFLTSLSVGKLTAKGCGSS